MNSKSLIFNEISSQPNSIVEYPLFNKGDKHRFDYGVLFLNKDIEQLCNARGISLQSIKATLSNIYDLIEVEIDNKKKKTGSRQLKERKPSEISN
jgi:hypothetical protein